MVQRLDELLQACTVKIAVPGQGWGTGFFVAPGVILTCAHVVKSLRPDATAQICWQQEGFAEATVAQFVPELDLALLQFTPPNVDLPCVYLDEELEPGHELYFFGYPDQDFDNGCPVTGSCEGFTGDLPPLIKFKQGQVRPGMSGSALLNLETGKVCGMVKFTRDRSIDLGGGAISTQVIFQQFPELRALQQQFHQQDQRWKLLIPTLPDTHTINQIQTGADNNGDNVAGDKIGRDKVTVIINPPPPNPDGFSEINFQPYLTAIATTYEKWWQFYTLTDAEGKQQQAQQTAPIFDFGLMVQRVKKEVREQEETEPEQQQQEKIERLSVLDGLRKYADQQVLLVGRPGSGKSTALARLLLEEATQPQARIPVLVELRYWQGSLTQLILNAFARHGLPLTAAQMETVLSRALILFDGVNELPSEEARSQLSAFRRDHPKLPMVFTTRDLSLGGDLGIEQRLEMQPLTAAQMQAFGRAYVPEQAEQMLRQLRDRLREFGQTPLLLWMLCGLFQQTGAIPENLGLVFRLFTQGYERNLKQDVMVESEREWWKPVLQQLAWVMMQGEKPIELRVAISREDAVRAIAQFLEGKVPYAEDFARKCLRDLQKHHLIQAGMSNEALLTWR